MIGVTQEHIITNKPMNAIVETTNRNLKFSNWNSHWRNPSDSLSLSLSLCWRDLSTIDGVQFEVHWRDNFTLRLTRSDKAFWLSKTSGWRRWNFNWCWTDRSLKRLAELSARLVAELVFSAFVCLESSCSRNDEIQLITLSDNSLESFLQWNN